MAKVSQMVARQRAVLFLYGCGGDDGQSPVGMGGGGTQIFYTANLKIQPANLRRVDGTTYDSILKTKRSKVQGLTVFIYYNRAANWTISLTFLLLWLWAYGS